MRIGMILDAQFPPDIRVEKEAKSLHKAGHEVFIFSQHKKSFPAEEKEEHYFVVRFDTNRYKILKQLTRDFRKIAFYDPVWVQGIKDFIKIYHINALHVHDLPLVKTALKAARKYHLPVIADYHEDYPEHLEATKPADLTFLQEFYRSYKRWKKHEGRTSGKVDRIIVVAEDQKKNLHRDHGIPFQKITVVSNTVDIERFGDNAVEGISSNDEFIISYIGSLSPYRGLEVAIKAMPEIISHIPKAKLVIVGKGRGNIQTALEDLAKQLNVSNAIRFLGWIDYDRLPSYFRQADVGILTPHAHKHTEIAAPNKVFEYMYFKVPLVVSDRPTLKRYMEETKAGLTFKTSDPADFAKKIVQIYNDPAEYGEMGYKAVIEKYNWNIDGDRLVNLYNSLHQ